MDIFSSLGMSNKEQTQGGETSRTNSGLSEQAPIENWQKIDKFDEIGIAF